MSSQEKVWTVERVREMHKVEDIFFHACMNSIKGKEAEFIMMLMRSAMPPIKFPDGRVDKFHEYLQTL